MSFKTEISFEIDKKDWDNALMLNEASTAYQISDFYEPYNLTYGSKPIFVSVYDSTGKIVGQLSAVIHLSDYWLEPNIISKIISSKINLGSTLSWIHGPIIHDKENMEEILSLILTSLDKIAIENKVNLIKGSSPPQMRQSPANLYQKNGYKIIPWITYITDLQRSVEDIYKSLHNKTRYDIRKGEKNGLEFEVVSKEESYELYLDVKYNQKNKLQKIKKLNKKFFHNVWETSYKKNYQKMFLAKFEEKPIGAILNVLFNGNVVQVGVGNTPDRNLYGGPFLTWNSIKWSAENNFRTFDVGGANPSPVSKKEQGINLFKSKWSSKKIDYFLYTKVFNKTRRNISNIIKQPKSIKYKIKNLYQKKSDNN